MSDNLSTEQVADQLTTAGDGWRERLPDGADILHDKDKIYRDSVRHGDDVLYRNELTGKWHPVGWSDASKRRIYRARPMTDAEHFASLHSDDDGT